MASVQRISPCLWFDDEAEQAAAFYVSVFPNSRIGAIAHYGSAGQALHGRPPGSVLTVQFELDGMPFTALNGGPRFKFSEALSLQVLCDSQDEIDFFWDELGEGGPPQAQLCGWLKDRFGLSWQIVPRPIAHWLAGPPTPATERVLAAVLAMHKLDFAVLAHAHQGD